MRRQDSMLDLRRQKSLENMLNNVRSSPDAEFQPPIESDLILQDVTVEDFKQAVRDATGFQKQACGDVIDVTSIVASFEDHFFNVKHRQRPLSVLRNTDGLVGGSTFWKENRNCRLSLYDRGQPKPDERALTAVYFPAKLQFAQRFPHAPSIGAAPMSTMAQILYDQLDEIAKSNIGFIANNLGHYESNTSLQNDIKGDNSVWISEKDLSKSDNSFDSSREMSKKKRSVRSRVLKSLRKLLCCVGNNDEK